MATQPTSDPPQGANPVLGRTSDDQERTLIVNLKAVETAVAQIVAIVEMNARASDDAAAARWAALGRTGCEQGFMWLTKAVARPTGGLGRGRPTGPVATQPIAPPAPSVEPQPPAEAIQLPADPKTASGGPPRGQHDA